MKEVVELDESIVNVTIDFPSWVWVRLKALAKLQKKSGKDWIKAVVCKALKADLKPDKVKWTDIYESVLEEDASEKELMGLLRELFKQTVLHRVGRENHSYQSSDECSD